MSRFGPQPTAHPGIAREALRWTVAGLAAAVVIVLAVLFAAALSDQRWALAPVYALLAATVWWVWGTVAIGYRRPTADESAMVAAGPLWHMTTAARWSGAGGVPTVGDSLTLDPSRCRWCSRMLPRGTLGLPRKAFYVTLAHPDLVDKWGMPARRRDFVLRLDPVRIGRFRIRDDSAVALVDPVEAVVAEVIRRDETQR